MGLCQKLLRPIRNEFSPLSLSPALWLKADAGLITDGAAQFTAANSESLSSADNASLSTGDIDFTFAAWVWITTNTSDNEIACKGLGGPTNEWILRMSGSGGAPRFQISSGGGAFTTSVTWGSNLSAGQWYYIMCWHDATANQIAISVNDGTPVTASTSGDAPADRAGQFSLGRNNNGTHWNGLMDSAGFWKRVLTSDERTALYNSGSGKTYNDLTTAEKVSLVSWWNLNEISGTRYDSHGTNHLTDNNTVTYAAGVASGAALADGDPVTTWQDQSGNAKHLTQATAAKRPTLKLAIQNSKPVVRFDGVDDFLLNASVAWSGPASIFLVMKSRNNATSNRYWCSGTSNRQIGYDAAGGNLTLYSGLNGPNVNVGTSDFKILSAVYDGASSRLVMNAGTPSTGNSGTDYAVGLAIGAAVSGTACSDMDCGEVIVVPRVITTVEEAALFAYANSRWGVY